MVICNLACVVGSCYNINISARIPWKDRECAAPSFPHLGLVGLILQVHIALCLYSHDINPMNSPLNHHGNHHSSSNPMEISWKKHHQLTILPLEKKRPGDQHRQNVFHLAARILIWVQHKACRVLHILNNRKKIKELTNVKCVFV